MEQFLLLVRSEIFELFGNILAADDKYSPVKRENFLQQIQMQLSQKSKIFLDFSLRF